MRRYCIFTISLFALTLTSIGNAATPVRVTITNNSPTDGTFITPVWVGFHDGSFDSYNGGLSSQSGLERLAEDGDTSVISSDFLGGYTYIDDSGVSPVSARILSSQAGAERVDGTVGGAPIAPGSSVSLDLTIDTEGSNRYFSYASMVLPSNDYYIANGSPTGHDLMSLYGAAIGTEISFDVGMFGEINDAGTEVNFANISGAGDMVDDSIAGFGLLGADYVGQSVANTGADENGVNMTVASAYAEASSIRTAHPNLNFNDGGLYANGIATVTVSVVPEPASAALAVIGLCGLVSVSRKRRTV